MLASFPVLKRNMSPYSSGSEVPLLGYATRMIGLAGKKFSKLSKHPKYCLWQLHFSLPVRSPIPYTSIVLALSQVPPSLALPSKPFPTTVPVLIPSQLHTVYRFRIRLLRNAQSVVQRTPLRCSIRSGTHNSLPLRPLPFSRDCNHLNVHPLHNRLCNVLGIYESPRPIRIPLLFNNGYLLRRSGFVSLERQQRYSSYPSSDGNRYRIYRDQFGWDFGNVATWRNTKSSTEVYKSDDRLVGAFNCGATFCGS